MIVPLTRTSFTENPARGITFADLAPGTWFRRGPSMGIVLKISTAPKDNCIALEDIFRMFTVRPEEAIWRVYREAQVVVSE